LIAKSEGRARNVKASQSNFLRRVNKATPSKADQKREKNRRRKGNLTGEKWQKSPTGRLAILSREIGQKGTTKMCV